RPDVVAAAHAHSIYGKSWSSLGRRLDPLTQDACAFYEDHVVFDDYTGIVEETSEGDRIARALGLKKAAILRNHGLLTVGHSVREAGRWLTAMDEPFQADHNPDPAVQLLQLPQHPLIRADAVVGVVLVGWFHFQNLWQRISRSQPDLFK